MAKNKRDLCGKKIREICMMVRNKRHQYVKNKRDRYGKMDTTLVKVSLGVQLTVCEIGKSLVANVKLFRFSFVATRRESGPSLFQEIPESLLPQCRREHELSPTSARVGVVTAGTMLRTSSQSASFSAHNQVSVPMVL